MTTAAEPVGTVTIEPMSDATRPIVDALFAGYFIEMAAWDPGLVINEHGVPTWAAFGLPGPRSLDECARHNWWVRDQAHVHLVRRDGSPIGFAITATDPAIVPTGFEGEIMDFYITPKARMPGVARRAAHLALDTLRGRCLLYTLAANTRAQHFWRTVLAARHGDAVDELPGATEFRFTEPPGTLPA
jgi:predicted acetyltransferase